MDDSHLLFYHQKAVKMCEKYSDVLNQIIDYKTIRCVYDRNNEDEFYVIDRDLIYHLEWLKTIELSELIGCEDETNTPDVYARYEMLAIYMEQIPDSYSYAREYCSRESTIDIQYFHKALFLYMTKEEQTEIIDNYINMVYFIINVLDEIAFDIQSSFDYDCFHGIPIEYELESALCV